MPFVRLDFHRRFVLLNLRATQRTVRRGRYLSRRTARSNLGCSLPGVDPELHELSPPDRCLRVPPFLECSSTLGRVYPDVFGRWPANI